MSFSRPLLAASALALSLTAASALTGCHFFNHLLGKDSVDLSKADVQSMSVDIRKERKTICPREPVQMAIFVDAVLEGEKDKKPFETYTGHSEANKNDKLEFVDFAFNSEQGTVDKDGWFSPNESVLATADKEFLIKTVYKRRPDKFSFDTKYKPDYQCIKGGGKGGQDGASGSSGSSGPSGKDGQYGSDSQSGGQGSAGGQGGPGADGSNGGAGPHIVAYATYAKTPFYDKLVAIKVGGDVDDFLLAPIDQPLVIRANGGAGGAGGAGGGGGRGGSGGSGNPAGNGGSGGQGGGGGKGGSGGAGGTIELVYDARYPDLANLFKLDVSGGEGGAPGSGGSAGSGGSGGSGTTPQGSQSSTPSGQRGSDGSRGADGAPGQKGPDGHGSTKAGAVADHFSGLGAVTLLDGGAAPADAAPPPKGAKPVKTTKKPGAGK
jgi:hypothetical protein